MNMWQRGSQEATDGGCCCCCCGSELFWMFPDKRTSVVWPWTCNLKPGETDPGLAPSCVFVSVWSCGRSCLAASAPTDTQWFFFFLFFIWKLSSILWKCIMHSTLDRPSAGPLQTQTKWEQRPKGCLRSSLTRSQNKVKGKGWPTSAGPLDH